MKKSIFIAAAALVVTAFGTLAATAQNETYTGTVVSYGSGRNTRTSTNTFTLHLTGTTSDDEANRLIGILQEGGQKDLQDAVHKNDLGRFSVGSRVGPVVNAVRVDTWEGKKRIRAIFERWLNFSEIRGGYRSVDYPFGYIELLIDPATGKGDGQLIEAAQIRWKRDKKSNEYNVEIENYATFPSRLMGVSLRGN